MINIIDLNNVIINGVRQDIVSAIANNIESDLSAIVEALDNYDKDRKSIKKTNDLTLPKDFILQAKDLEIAKLKTQLSPAIHEITPQLLESGLLRWGQDAVSAVDGNTGELIMGLVIELKTTAMEPPSWNQCDRVKKMFGAIGTISSTWPTSDQAKAMQAILDRGCPSTGPVSPEKLSFQPWI